MLPVAYCCPKKGAGITFIPPIFCNDSIPSINLLADISEPRVDTALIKAGYISGAAHRFPSSKSNPIYSSFISLIFAYTAVDISNQALLKSSVDNVDGIPM
jgi:hypothetical protein